MYAIRSYYATGTNVTLTATPNSGGSFINWSGDASGSTNPLTVTLNSDMNITANFGPSAPANPTSVTVGSSTICNGSSTSLTANGASGTVYWYSGSCGGTLVGTGNPINVSPATTTTYYARNYTTAFSPGCASATVTVDPVSAGGSITGTNAITYGSSTGTMTFRITSYNVCYTKLFRIAAISDPIRDDVPDAVQNCLNAGIDVKIVTGDTPGTAKEIGRQIGILGLEIPEFAVLSGQEFEKMTDDEIIKIAKGLKILCRARPSDKQRLVQLLQKAGEIVAVTGDGTNDAPALNYAHVGLSMGSGTSVAKEASDITVITSYSIHYTKLYDRCWKQIVGCCLILCHISDY